MKFKETILMLRKIVITIFKHYESKILPVFRFMLSFYVLNMFKEGLNYDGALNHIIITLGLALIGAFASAECIGLCSIFLVVAYLLPTNLILAMVLFVVLIIVYILYGRLFPRESIMIIVTLVAFSLNLELLVPIISALLGSYMTVFAIMIGIVIWYAVPSLLSLMPNLTLDKAQLPDGIEQLLMLDFKSVLVDQNMLVMMIVCFSVFSVIYIIRKLSIDYSPYIAIVIGAIMNVVGFGMATLFFRDIHINIVFLMLKVILFSIIAIGIQFLSIALDYQRAETVTFEDDDNYYYVKIIPKIKLNFKQNKVKKVYTDLSHANTYNGILTEDEN